MIGNDIQLFHKLLDSLSESLRQLAIKYELLERESTERQKITETAQNLAQQVIPTLVGVAQETREVRQQISAVVSSLDALSAKETTSRESHDGMEADLRSLKEQVKPISDLASMLRKPLIWVLVVWTFISTSLAIIGVWQKVSSSWDSTDNRAVAQYSHYHTNKIPAKVSGGNP